ncbi:replication protein P [Scandinavium sp. H11S7]|uniref:Replication protein P n=1 Tax=Scandinavium hiltneri TaxID=2926519 RepID=A0ABT2E1D4_9ENTR|nr:replication protein P [Scandinavium hiltneri]MCS2161684.1 replication protein P [Scandinavium hiltneri]
MTMQLLTAIQNRDGAAMARMAGAGREDQSVINAEAESLVDALFRQLKQIFPAASQTNLKTDADEKTAKRQWIAAFSENGIRTREQLSAGVRHARASASPFWPSPGQFIKWCKDSSTVLGVSLADVMNEFHRYSREKGIHVGGAERFPWAHPVMYWIVTETRRAMYQRQLSETETEKYAAKKLEEWALKVASGEQVPAPVMAIECKAEVIPTSHESRNTGYHPEGKTFGCMPNAASLGALTPAQWLWDEYLKGKNRGQIR